MCIAVCARAIVGSVILVYLVTFVVKFYLNKQTSLFSNSSIIEEVFDIKTFPSVIELNRNKET